MNYPVWDIDIGYGVLMGVVAVVHVFISHFAIGGGLFLVTAEYHARRGNSGQWISFLERLTKFFVLTTVVLGALSGVAIWFIIGLLNPTATEMLIHNFVWAWAIEWTLFLVEILAALLYFYGWRSMSPRDHLIIGWIYFLSAWLSLFVINGIVSFMLTPGAWLVTGSVWDGLFNPSFWSSLILRSAICVLLAGLYALLVASREDSDDFKRTLVRFSCTWAIGGLLFCIPCFSWFQGTIPEEVTKTAVENIPTVVSALSALPWFIAALGVLIAFVLFFPRHLSAGYSLLLLLLGLATFGAFELYREAVRKPYVIRGYMYANGIEVGREEEFRKNGYLSKMKYRTGNDGKDLFNHLCRSCHTLNHYKALKPAFDGTDREFIVASLGGLSVMKGNMPPFWGSEEELELLADFIYSNTDRRHLKVIYRLSGATLGQRVFEVRCGKCHFSGGENDIIDSLADYDEEETLDLLDTAEDYDDEMPAFTGDEEERRALVNYVASLGEKGD